jgi:alkylated DNA repair protein alkB homolog 1
MNQSASTYKLCENKFKPREHVLSIEDASKLAIDFSNVSSNSLEFRDLIDLIYESSSTHELHDADAFEAPAIYGLKSVPGFYFLPNLVPSNPGSRSFSDEQVEKWIRLILREYLEPPYRRNIDAAWDPDVSNDGIPIYGGYVGEVVANTPSPPVNLWKEYVEYVNNKKNIKQFKGSFSWLEKISWSTGGYQYDWTSREYHVETDSDYEIHSHGHSPTRWFVPFPKKLADLAIRVCEFVDKHACKYYQSKLKLDEASDCQASMDQYGLPMSILPEACIVNVYQNPTNNNSTPMGGHKDEMERTYKHPVVSVSFGCTAVYLLGGETKDVPPIPVIIRSGDVVILSGSCRTHFHGVARVFNNTSPPELFQKQSIQDDQNIDKKEISNELPVSIEEESVFRTWISSSRLNINVRQVMETL